MEISIKQLGNSISEFSLTASLSDLTPSYNKAFREVQKNVELKGFRKGKAPRQMIEKMYKGQIEMDSQVDFVNEKFAAYTKENNLSVLSQPTLKDVKKDVENGTISFVVTFETLAPFDIPEYKDFDIYEPTHAVADEEIENEIYRLVRANGTFEDAEQVTDYDYVVGINVVDTEHSEDSHVPSEQTNNVYLNDDKVDPELKNLLMNAKTNDSFDYTSQHGDHTHNFKIIVTDIQKLIPAEFNNELVEKVTNGKFVTTEELRENIGYDLQELWDKKSRELMENQIIEQIISKVDMTLPESLVQRTAIDLFNAEYKDKGLNYDKLDEQMKNMVVYMNSQKAETFIKWNRVRDAIIAKEDIQVEDYDLQQYIEELLPQTNQPEDKIREQLYANENFIFEVKSKKLMDLLFDFALTKEVSFEEFDKIMKAEQEGLEEETAHSATAQLVDMTDKIDEIGLNNDNN